jgi:hypothetical protein
MYSQSSKHKPKQKINPMDIDFGFTIKNHPEFFTKLSSRDHVSQPPLPTKRPLSSRMPPVLGGFFSRPPSALDGYLARGGGGRGRRVGNLGATLKPKIFPPTLMRNVPKRFFK